MAKLNSSSESRKKLFSLRSGRKIVGEVTEPLLNSELAALPKTMSRREKRALLRDFKKLLEKGKAHQRPEDPTGMTCRNHPEYSSALCPHCT